MKTKQPKKTRVRDQFVGAWFDESQAKRIKALARGNGVSAVVRDAVQIGLEVLEHELVDRQIMMRSRRTPAPEVVVSSADVAQQAQVDAVENAARLAVQRNPIGKQRR